MHRVMKSVTRNTHMPRESFC